MVTDDADRNSGQTRTSSLVPSGKGTDDITKAVIGAAYEVCRTLGLGFVEAVYQRALAVEIRTRGPTVARELAFPVHDKGNVVGSYRADLVVEQTVIVETKGATGFSDPHAAQTLNYLRASGLRVGLLFNFGLARVAV